MRRQRARDVQSNHSEDSLARSATPELCAVDGKPMFPRCTLRRLQLQPRRAASIAAMSIFFISIIASNARLAAAESGSVIALVRAIGVICQDKPHLSLHHPHALSSPPLPTIAFQ